MKTILVAILFLTMTTAAMASTVVLSWDKSADTTVTGYKVYYQPDSSAPPFKTPLDAKTQTTATITGLDPAKSYYFVVTAYNALGMESGYSNVVSVPAFPAIPAGIKAVTISW